MSLQEHECTNAQEVTNRYLIAIMCLLIAALCLVEPI